MSGHYPYLFEPTYKEYPWGGDRLAREWGRREAPAVCAESWEVADRPEGMSVVANGPRRGRTLRALIEEDPGGIIGAGACAATPFPLLIKIIDARERLSVQVHPSEKTAVATGGEPKTEMWVVLQADSGAKVFSGLQSGVDAGRLEQALRAGRIESLLRTVPAVPGQAIYVPGGRVHAIAEGCLLLEVQQNSNTTYRLYDWGRVSPQGRPRALHVEQALRAIDWDDEPEGARSPRPLTGPGPNRRYELLNGPFFRVERMELSVEETVHDGTDACTALFAVSGRATVAGDAGQAVLETGRTCLLPAALSACRLTPTDPETVVVAIRPSSLSGP